MAQAILPDFKFTRTIASDGTHSGKSIQFWRCECGWTTSSTTWEAGGKIPDRPTLLQMSELSNHFHLKPLPQLTDTSAMAKSRDPNSYNPLIRQILKQALDNGHYESAPMEEKYAHSLRFDLNGYKKALEAIGSPDFETLGLASISLRKIPYQSANNQPLAIIEVYPGGPAWTSPEAMAAITAGLQKPKESPSFDIPDQAKLDALAQYGTLLNDLTPPEQHLQEVPPDDDAPVIIP